MASSESTSFQDRFQDLNDRRMERTRKHPLINMGSDNHRNRKG